MPTYETHVYLPKGSSEAEVVIGPSSAEEFVERTIACAKRDGKPVVMTVFVNKSGALPDTSSER